MMLESLANRPETVATGPPWPDIFPPEADKCRSCCVILEMPWSISVVTGPCFPGTCRRVQPRGLPRGASMSFRPGSGWIYFSGYYRILEVEKTSPVETRPPDPQTMAASNRLTAPWLPTRYRGDCPGGNRAMGLGNHAHGFSRGAGKAKYCA